MITNKLPLNSLDKLNEVYENFKKLSKAYIEYTKIAVDKIKNVEDLAGLKISNTDNYVHIFTDWDTFYNSLPQAIKNIFKQTVKVSVDGKKKQDITSSDFNRMIKEIPLNFDVPQETI